MNCGELRRYLSAYLDSELDPRTTLDVGAHVERCPDCARRVDAESRLERCIRERLAAAPVRDDFWDDVHACLDRPAHRLSWWVPSLSAAALLLVLVGAFALWHRQAANTPANPRELIAVLRERGLDFERDGPAALHAYEPVASPVAAATFLGQYLGAAAETHLHVMPGPDYGHPVELIGRGTAHIGGKVVPVLHYRCCERNYCVYFIVPAALEGFPATARALFGGEALTCSEVKAATVALRRCAGTGGVIAVVGPPCAPVLATALARP